MSDQNDLMKMQSDLATEIAALCYARVRNSTYTLAQTLAPLANASGYILSTVADVEYGAVAAEMARLIEKSAKDNAEVTRNEQ